MIVGIVNAVNLTDGIDGLDGSITFFRVNRCYAYCKHTQLPRNYGNGRPLRQVHALVFWYGIFIPQKYLWVTQARCSSADLYADLLSQ